VTAAVSANEFKSVSAEMQLNLTFVGQFVLSDVAVVCLVCLIGLL